MQAYMGFAQVYDMFMDNVPYKEWSEYLIGLLHEHGIKDGILLEIGCGTGKMTRLLAKQGYDMIGIDNSGEMLQIAMEQNFTGCDEEKDEAAKETIENEMEDKPTDILYLCQDMREFELYGTVKAVVSVCDSMNYILEEADLLEVFKLVNNYLDPKGVFIFDLNTVYKYSEILGETTICENREEGSFIWENYYDEDEQINEYELTLFVKEESGLYRKYEETHYQRGYELETVQKLLADAGLEFVAAYDAFSKELPKEESERIYIVARENGK